MVRKEVEEAVHNPRAGKSPGVDNIPSELLKNGGETTTIALTVIQEDLGDEGMVEEVDTIAHCTLTTEMPPQAM